MLINKTSPEANDIKKEETNDIYRPEISDANQEEMKGKVGEGRRLRNERKRRQR